MRKKNRFLFWISVIAFIVYLFYLFNINPIEISSRTFSSIKSTNEQANMDQDPLITQCYESYNECASIIEQKYGIKVTLLEKQKFTEPLAARSFYRTWSSPLSNELLLYGDNLEYPIVLFAAKEEGSGGVVPFVAICEYSGSLTSYTKSISGC